MVRPSACLTLILALSLAGIPVIQADITPVNFPSRLSTLGAISGDVVNIDPVNILVFVKDATGIVQAVHVDEHVQISRRGETIPFHDVSLGDFVTVSPK